MYVGTAKNLCPSLRVVDYDFGAYESVSREFYTILVNTLHDYIKVISIDEALLDITSSVSSFQDCFEIAESIRSQVREKTNCEVSVGIGPNVLLARLALRKAKPHNVYSLSIENAFDVLSPLSVQDLPGWALHKRRNFLICTVCVLLGSCKELKNSIFKRLLG